MKNETSQPQHTQGEWKVNIHPLQTDIIDENGDIIAGIYLRNKNEEQQANAQRIVKAVNMHDGLVEALKVIKFQFSGIDDEDLTKTERNIMNLCEQTLKQAEQK